MLPAFFLFVIVHTRATRKAVPSVLFRRFAAAFAHKMALLLSVTTEKAACKHALFPVCD